MDKKDKKPGEKSAKPVPKGSIGTKKTKPVPKGSIRTEEKQGKKAVDPSQRDPFGKKDFFVEEDNDGTEKEYVEEAEIEFIEETPTIEDISTVEDDDDDDDEFFGDEEY